MGQKFTLLTCLLLSFGLLKAQENIDFSNAEDFAIESRMASKATVIHSESFNNWNTSTWTAHVLGLGTKGWKDNFLGYSDACATHGYSMEVCNDWLVSPAIVVPAGASFKFFEKNNMMESYSHHGVWISEASADPSSSDFVQVATFSEVADSWIEREVSLNDYIGKTIHIGFKYTGYDATKWFVDEAEVSISNEHELGITKGRVYGPTYAASECPVKVSVINNGAVDESGITVTATQGDYSSTKTVDVVAGETIEVEFDLYTVSEEDAMVTVKVISEEDTFQDNNSIDLPVYPIKNPVYAFNLYSKAGLPVSPAVFDMDHPEMVHTLLSESVTEKSWAGVYVNDEYILATLEKNADKKYEPRNIVKVNKTTGAYELIAETQIMYYALAYNAADGFVYGIGKDGGEGTRNLYKLNVETGASELIMETPAGTPVLYTFAIDSEGNAFGISSLGILYSIDLTTYEATLIGALAITPKYIQSMAFNPNDDKLYWAAYYKDGSNHGEFYTIDTETAAIEKVSDYFGGRCELSGLSFPVIEETPIGNTVALSEGFNTWPAEGWTSHILDAGKGFTQGTIVPFEGAGFAARYDEFAECNDWLVSPKVVVPANGILEFYENNRYTGSSYVMHGLYITTGSADPTDDEFVLLKEYNEVHEVWTQVSYDLKDYVGQEVAIAFHYKGNFADIWEIDNVRIFTPQDYDAAISLSDLPTYSFINTKITPTVSVVNLGTKEMADISVVMNVNGVETATKSVTVAAGAAEELSFDEMELTADIELSFTASFEGDVTLDNNAASASIKTLVSSEAYGYRIFSTVDTEKVGPVAFNSNDVTKYTDLENMSKDNKSVFAGTMVNNLWFVSMHESIADEKQNRQEILNNRANVPTSLALINKDNGEVYGMYPSTRIYSEMAFNPYDHLVYAIGFEDSKQKLFGIDYKTGEAKEIAVATDETPVLATLAIDVNGVAYGVSSNSNLYRVNLESFELELVGSTGVNEIKYIQSMAFDNENNQLFWSHSADSFTGFYYIDVETGKAHLLNIPSNDAEISAIGFDYGFERHYAAIHVENKEAVELAGVSLTIGDKTLVSDEYGYAAFVNLDLNTDYSVAAELGEISTSFDINIDESKVVEFVLDHVGVDELNAIHASVYPNPAQSVLYIDGVKNLNRVELIDMEGSIVFSATALSGNAINVSEFNPGVYTLRIFAEEGMANQKIILKK